MATSKRKYRAVSSYSALSKLLKKFFYAGQHGALDFETTALRPAEGRVRLVSICSDKVSWLVDFDKCGGFRKCAKLFKHGRWVVFNSGFEMRWFIAAGAPKTRCIDLANARRAVMGGGNYSLKQIALWDLGIEMNKEEQASNWGAKKLTRSQLDYAYDDADTTWKLWLHWTKDHTPGQHDAMVMLDNLVPAIIEMEEQGILIDVKHHQTLVDGWEETQTKLITILRTLVSDGEVRNINSDTQWGDYFAVIMPDNWLSAWPRTEKAGRLSCTSAHLRRLAGNATGTPLETLFDALADYKTVTKYISSFGRTIINTAQLAVDGRVRPRVNIAAARTGRFSTSGPNVQQIPRNKDILGEPTSVRKSFIASRGCRLVSLDYSGIELRVLALLSGDKQLLEDMINGDVHLEVAQEMVGRPLDKKTKEGKEARQKAKGVSFGIIYGSGARGLASTMRTSVGRAERYIDFWEGRYPDAFGYRHKVMAEAERTRFITTVDGGTIYLGKRPDLPKCANYPVQRAALSVMARSIARHKRTLDRLREASQPQARWDRVFMLATIHDALIDEAPTKLAKNCLHMMEEDMTYGYLAVFPGAPTDRLVEGGIGQHWGALS